MTYDFLVRGEPAPQGSKRHVGKGVLIESSKRVAPWRQDVREAAERALAGAAPLNGPVRVDIEFVLRRPMSAPKWRKLPSVRPDIDKLVRSTLDALKSAGVYGDDAQVTDLRATKRYGVLVGARVQVTKAAVEAS